MALLFMDSFAHYATADLLEKYTSGTGIGTTTVIHATNGRRTSPCLQSTGSASNSTNPMVTKQLAPADATCLVGYACNPTSLAADYPLFTVGDSSSTWHLGVYATASGALNVRQGTSFGGAVMGTTAAVLPTGSYTYIEIKVTIHDSAGVVVIKFNGTPVLSLTGVDTKHQTLAGWTHVGFHTGNNASSSPGTRIADLYVLDGSGAAPWNDLLGDCRVDVCAPTAAGASAGWTPSAGANYACVDEAPPNDDTDYVSTTTLDVIDTYTVQDLPVAGSTILGVQHCLNLKKMDAGAVSVAPVVRHSGSDYVGANLSPSTSYAFGLQVQQTNPGTGAAWTEAGFNAAAFGVKRTA
jgi:hypothetical protein